MSSKFRDHIRSNVVGYAALFVALSGTAYAVDGPLDGQNRVGSADIINNDVASVDLADETLTGDDIKNASLNGGEISPATLGIREIIGNSLSAQVIAPDAIGNSELAPLAVGAAEMGTNAIPADGIGINGSSKLATDSVDFDEVAAGAIRGIQVQDNSLTGNDIAESTLAPTVRAYGNRGFDPVVVGDAWKGVLAKGVPDGTYVVMANLHAHLIEHDVRRIVFECRLRANDKVIALQVQGLNEVSENTGQYEVFPLITWATVATGINNIFLECKGDERAGDVWVERPTIVAIPVQSVD